MHRTGLTLLEESMILWVLVQCFDGCDWWGLWVRMVIERYGCESDCGIIEGKGLRVVGD